MDRASQTFWGTVIFFTLVGLYFYLSQPEYDGGPTRWARWKAIVLSSWEQWDVARDARRKPANRALSPAETNDETNETLQVDAEIYDDIFHSGENMAIARMISEGVVKLTEGVKSGTGKRSGDAYSKRSREIQALVKAMQDKYPNRTPEQEQARREIGIER